jgi:hypothetical protein
MEILLAAFDRTLTSADVKRNIPFPFVVPPGITQLHIRLTFSPAMVDEIRNMLTLSLFDPAGFRGAGHRHGAQHEVVISRAHATHGYCAGAIVPGEWQVVVDTHMIMPDSPCIIRLEVNGSDAPVGDSPAPLPAGLTRARGRGWYRGDLHAHTLHSDAAWNVPDLLAWAREQKLDFVTLSDHNTVAGLAQIDAARADDLLTMGGMEFTTFWGHALALGVREWIDWRTNPAVGGARTMPQIAAEVEARGGLFIIAHPKAVGDPYCTGCQWVFPDMMPGPARVVEVWNSDLRGDSRNAMGLKLAYDWFNAGYRMALTAGTDNHGPRGTVPHYGYNSVYAEELSETEILRAIRAGHSYISAGPTLGLSAMLGEQQAMMGDVLDARSGQPAKFAARWEDSPANAELALIADGEPEFTLSASGEGSHAWEIPAGEAHWCLLTLRTASGEILALTNPIFLDGRS